MKNRQSHFTLIELLVVISVIAVLAGMILGVASLVSTKTATSKTEAMIKKLEIALEAYKAKTGYYIQNISTDTGFKIDSFDTELIKCIDYQAMYPNDIDHTNKKVIDAWGNTLYYKCPGTRNTSSFDLGSTGSDGKYGNATTSPANLGLGDDICNFKR